MSDLHKCQWCRSLGRDTILVDHPTGGLTCPLDGCFYNGLNIRFESDAKEPGIEADTEIETREELETLREKVRQANNYLSGGGCGARSVQHAAELWGKM